MKLEFLCSSIISVLFATFLLFIFSIFLYFVHLSCLKAVKYYYQYIGYVLRSFTAMRPQFIIIISYLKLSYLARERFNGTCNVVKLILCMFRKTGEFDKSASKMGRASPFSSSTREVFSNQK